MLFLYSIQNAQYQDFLSVAKELESLSEVRLF